MKKGYQGDELWTAVNPAAGKREIVDQEGEFIPGKTNVKLIKLYYWKRIWVRDNPSGFTFQRRGERVHARTCWLKLAKQTTITKQGWLESSRCEGGVIRPSSFNNLPLN